MVASVAVFSPGFRVTDTNDEPINGATIEFYGAGTSTPKTVYTDKDLTVALGTTVTTDAGGYPSTGGNKTLIYTGISPYKIIVKDADGVALYTHDNVQGAVEGGSGTGESLSAVGTFGINVGDVKLSVSSSPDAGFIRLIDTAQTLLKASYPDLNAWASRQGYPWGSASTTFNIPPAGGYFLRFGASGTTVDPDGARTPGTVQTQQLLTHTHSVTGTTGGESNTHSHATQGSISDTTFPFTGGGGNSLYGQSLKADGVTAANTTGHTHDFTATAAAPAAAGAENRPKNITMYADMLAVPALVSTGLIGANGFAYKYESSTTATDITAGLFGFNNATLTSATTLYINETDNLGSDLSAVLQAIPALSYVYITKVGAPAVFIAFTVTTAATDAGTYKSFTISDVKTGGTWADGDSASVLVMRSGNVSSKQEFYDGGTTNRPYVGSSADNLVLGNNGANRWSVYNVGAGNYSMLPLTDNTYSLGTSGQRVSVVYAGTGTINTSDEREKKKHHLVDDKLRAVGRRISLHVYQWLDAMEKKGDGARLHVGPMAQEVAAAFEAEGLDPKRYGAFIEEALSEIDSNGNMVPVLEPDGTQKVRLSLRMDQVHSLMIAGLMAAPKAEEIKAVKPTPILPGFTAVDAAHEVNAIAREALELMEADLSPWVYEAKRREAKEVLDDPAPSPDKYPLLASMVLGTDAPVKADYDAAALKLFEFDRDRAQRAAKIERARSAALLSISQAEPDQLEDIVKTFEGAAA